MNYSRNLKILSIGGLKSEASGNEIVERLHRTLLDEHFQIKGRIKFYKSLEETRTDLDSYLQVYNYQRSHQGRNINGRTPHHAFVEGLANRISKEDSVA